MKNLYRSICTYSLLSLALFNGAGCNTANIKAEETGSNKAEIKAEAVFNNEEPPKLVSDDRAAPQLSAASVAGNYDYDTYDDGEGYDNSLEIKHVGGNKLYVFLSGSYIYKIGETQSFHEAEGKGDAVLRGNTATATLVDEAGKLCRATITFKKNEAAVKIPGTCQFNIALDGVYKRVSAKSKTPVKHDAPKIREVSYRDLGDFINEFNEKKPGDHYIITDVPANKIDKITRADEFGNASYKNLFYLQTNDADSDTGNGFLTSKAMLESITREVEHEPAALRITAVLIESNGEFDVYRMSFVTKIEGLSDDGAVLWTATGGEPARVKFAH